MSKVFCLPNGHNQTTLPRQTAQILLFPAPARRNTLRPLDRIEALQWAEIAQSRGLRRVEICDEETDPEIGHFVLVYEHGRDWATWGVSRDCGFSLWRTGASGEIGQFATMRGALDAILVQPRLMRQKLPIR